MLILCSIPLGETAHLALSTRPPPKLGNDTVIFYFCGTHYQQQEDRIHFASVGAFFSVFFSKYRQLILMRTSRTFFSKSQKHKRHCLFAPLASNHESRKIHDSVCFSPVSVDVKTPPNKSITHTRSRILKGNPLFFLRLRSLIEHFSLGLSEPLRN